MTHDAGHPPEPPEKGTVHVHDDDHGHGHGGHDDHGHGHGGELAWEIIPETSGADGLLMALAFFCLFGLFVFAGIMLSAPPHHDAQSADHGAPQVEHQGAPGEVVLPTKPEKGAPPVQQSDVPQDVPSNQQGAPAERH
jgi:hypothetical protein